MPKIKILKEKNIDVKKMFLAFSFAIAVLIVVVISKSYAIYKVQKELDLIKSQIGTYKTGDYQVAVLVDGKEASTFPSYETNYKVESVDCTNGVTATFDVKNWQLNIADMSSTSCKCTVSFNSKEKNEITPVAMSKTELLALNEEITNTSAKQLANYLYPVGSIYLSTEDDTIDKVESKFGGTWVKYSENTMLMGAGSSYAVNSTGGASSVKLTNENLPAHNHPFTATGSVSSKFTGSASNTSTSGAHSHSVTGPPNHTYGISMGNDVKNANVNFVIRAYSLNNANTVYGQIVTSNDGNHYHSVTASGSVSSTFTGTASNTTGCTNCSATNVDILNPYTAVYMYKRTA